MSFRLLTAVLAGVFVLTTATATSAQPCEPEWDLTPGVPGVTGGYVGAFAVWDDGNGPRLYAGGSFSSIGGNVQARFLGRWNRQTNVWQAVGGGLNPGFTNAFVSSIVQFGGDLIVGGFYNNAANVPGTKSIARFDGTNWHSLSANFDPNGASAIWTMLPWDA